MGDARTRRIEKNRIDDALFLDQNRVTVVVVEGAAAGTEVVIHRRETVIGRNAGADITLPADTLCRDCYRPGVLWAIRQVVNLKGLVLGLDKILGV